MRVVANAPVDVRLEQGEPVALIWRDTEWRVIDRPTLLREEAEWLHPRITHAPDARRMGWRFTACCATQDEVRTFDVLEGGASWRLLYVWD